MMEIPEPWVLSIDHTGQWLSECKPIAIKKHGRKAKSIFRYSFDFLRRLLLNLEQYETEFCRSLRFLSCT